MHSSFIRKFLRITVIPLIGFLASCSFEGSQEYQKTFEKIIMSTRLHYGLAGIYWISNDHIVLSAYIDTEKKTKDHGIYQININDGSFIKIVELTDDQPTYLDYCFTKNTLYVGGVIDNIEILDTSLNYKVRLKDFDKKNRTNTYSPLRCGFYERPIEGYGFLALREEDGFIKNGRKYMGADKYRQVFLADNNGNTIKHLIDHKLHPRKPHDLEKALSVRRFAEHENAYFGQAPFNGRLTQCTYLSWLYRDSWEAKQRKLCFNEWQESSKRVLLVKDGLYIQTHSTKSGNPNAYVIHNEKGSVIDDGIVDGSTVSPDGCKVAYAFAKTWKLGIRSSLKIFDHCGYVNRPESSILGFSLDTGDGSSNKTRRNYKVEPFYFVD